LRAAEFAVARFARLVFNSDPAVAAGLALFIVILVFK
jgi:hypothetical protein